MESGRKSRLCQDSEYSYGNARSQRICPDSRYGSSRCGRQPADQRRARCNLRRRQRDPSRNSDQAYPDQRWDRSQVQRLYGRSSSAALPRRDPRSRCRRCGRDDRYGEGGRQVRIYSSAGRRCSLRAGYGLLQEP